MSGKLKEVRERMKSVRSTQQITKAMKMVSAAKLRKATEAITQMRPYADRLNKMLSNILSNVEGDIDLSFGTVRPIERVLIVVITSNRGLCGAFNTNIIKEGISLIEGKYSTVREAGNLEILCVGKRGYDFFKKKYSDCKMNAEYVGLFSDLSFENTSVVPQMIMDAFENGEYDAIETVYGQFENAATQFPVQAQFLPVPKIKETKKSKRKADYIFEPDKENLLKTLIPSIMKIQFQKYLLDTNASEHGARMTAMDKATENAEELMKDLKIFYNKVRQEAITSQISEIVGGAASLEG